jgi:hypothetical protein
MFRAAPRLSSALKQVLHPLNVLGFCDFVKVLAERPNAMPLSRERRRGSRIRPMVPRRSSVAAAVRRHAASSADKTAVNCDDKRVTQRNKSAPAAIIYASQHPNVAVRL